MGKQIGLLLTPVDLPSFERVLRARGDVTFLSTIANEAGVVVLPTIAMEAEDYGTVSVFCVVAPEPALGAIVFDGPSIDGRRIDVNLSHAMDLWRPFCDGRTIRRGRLWYEESPYVGDGRYMQKTAAFGSWAARLFGRVRRNLHYDRNLLTYVGSDAAAKLASGELKLG